jgi:hypothetical protein
MPRSYLDVLCGVLSKYGAHVIAEFVALFLRDAGKSCGSVFRCQSALEFYLRDQKVRMRALNYMLVSHGCKAAAVASQKLRAEGTEWAEGAKGAEGEGGAHATGAVGAREEEEAQIAAAASLTPRSCLCKRWTENDDCIIIGDLYRQLA